MFCKRVLCTTSVDVLRGSPWSVLYICSGDFEKCDRAMRSVLVAWSTHELRRFTTVSISVRDRTNWRALSVSFLLSDISLYLKQSVPVDKSVNCYTWDTY